MTLSWRVARFWAILNFRFAHPYGVQVCGFSDPQFSLSRWPIPIRLFLAGGVIRWRDLDLADRIQLAKCRPKFRSFEWVIEHTEVSEHDLLKKREVVERCHSGRWSTSPGWLYAHGARLVCDPRRH
jgi:hypothetical protein